MLGYSIAYFTEQFWQEVSLKARPVCRSLSPINSLTPNSRPFTDSKLHRQLSAWFSWWSRIREWGKCHNRWTPPISPFDVGKASPLLNKLTTVSSVCQTCILSIPVTQDMAEKYSSNLKTLHMAGPPSHTGWQPCDIIWGLEGYDFKS